jgi:hypothetical protein
MLKKFLFQLLTFLFLPFTLISFQASAQMIRSPFKNDLLRDGLKGAVKSKSEYSDTKLQRITKYNKNGLLTSLSQYCTKGKLQTACLYFSCLYDKKGNKIKELDESFITDYHYDTSDSLIEKTQRSAEVNGKIKSHVKYTYNNLGKLLSQHQTNFQYNSEKIDFIHFIEYTYDSKYKLICDTTIHKAAGKPNVKLINYYYDNDNNLIQKKESGKNGQIGIITSYTYDTNKRLIEKIEAYPKTSPDKYFNHEVNLYDQAGNVIERIYYNEDGTVFYKDIYQFDQKKNMTVRIHYKGIEQTAETRYTYNAQNLLIAEEEYFQGKQHANKKYLYDSRANLISFKSFDESRKTKLNLSYKLEYYN